MALPVSHIGQDAQLNGSRDNTSLRSRSQAGGGEGNEQPDWVSSLRWNQLENYKRLKQTHDRWKRHEPELWKAFQECQDRVWSHMPAC